MVASANKVCLGPDGLAVRLAATTDATRVAEIYNQGIADRAATFETSLRTTDQMRARIQENPSRYPVLVADADGILAGWASIGAYRPRDCYAGVGEFSVYIDRAHRGRGVGSALLMALVREASARGYWKLVSRIFPFNAGSRALCRSCGFREVGLYERHARLDGQWLDVVIVERLIAENQD
jgi:L-amino acid N-acyltransferase YncA